MNNKIYTVRPTLFRIADSVIGEDGVTIPCIQGQLSEVDVVSQNGYRYKKDFWNAVLSNPVIQNRINGRDMLGMVEHPSDDLDYLHTPYNKASHVVMKAWVEDDGNPYGTIGLLNNEQGNNIKALVDLGHHPGVSTRGMGDILQDGISQYVSDSGYALITWDIVRCPNFQDLKLEKISDSLRSTSDFKELVQMYHLRDSVDENYNKENLARDMNELVTEFSNKFKNLIQKC